MTEPVLTQRALNRALLARQLLLERAKLPIPDALDQLGGIQNQYAPNAYIRLWSCLAGFGRDHLSRAYEDGSVVQGTLMRGTIHAVSAGDYHSFAAGIRRTQQEWSRRVYRGDDRRRRTVATRVRRALAGRTVTRKELTDLLGDSDPSIKHTIDVDAELVRVPPSGTWERRRADLYGLADDVIGHHAEVHEADGLAHLVRRYLGAFGPASMRAIAEFTGVPATRLKPVIAALELRHFRDEAGRQLLDVLDAALPDADTPAPVRFLPTWDAALLVHARGTQILPDAYRPRIFYTKMPPSFPTFLVDGQVAGTWRYEEGRVTLAPFHRLAARDRRELDDEAERLAAFHAD